MRGFIKGEHIFNIFSAVYWGGQIGILSVLGGTRPPQRMRGYALTDQPPLTTVQLLQHGIIGLIRDGDESAYRREVEQLALWCGRNNLELNSLKTV